nr:MAG TPA: hypothetical protein [Caudoviricetes sp.]
MGTRFKSLKTRINTGFLTSKLFPLSVGEQ